MMNQCHSGMVFLLGCTIGVSAQGWAGTVDFSVQVLEAFDPSTFNVVPIPPLDRPFDGDSVLLQFGLSVVPTLGPGDRDFRNFVTSIGLDGDITDPGLGYAPHPSPMVRLDFGPFTREEPVFPTNQDAGEPGDLQSILVSKAAPLSDTDPRTLWDEYPMLFGSVFLLWGGQEAQLSMTGQASFNVPGGDAAPVFDYEPVTFVIGAPIPEPPTEVLAWLTIVAVVFSGTKLGVLRSSVS